MTRINLVPVTELSSKHLVAEYREITRIPGNIRKSLEAKRGFKFSDIPASYTLGTGHVKFFYNKVTFLKRRYNSLVEEMLKRGYNPSFTSTEAFDGLPAWCYGDYTPPLEALAINIQRIVERGGRSVQVIPQD